MAVEIALTANELMDQAGMTAEHYMIDAIKTINKHLGAGYAREHPELVAAYMQTAAIDFHGALMKVALQDMRDAIAELSSTVEEGLNGIGYVIEEAAEDQPV